MLTQIVLSVGHAQDHGINNFLARAGNSCPTHHLAGVFAWFDLVYTAHTTVVSFTHAILCPKTRASS